MTKKEKEEQEIYQRGFNAAYDEVAVIINFVITEIKENMIEEHDSETYRNMDYTVSELWKLKETLGID